MTMTLARISRIANNRRVASSLVAVRNLYHRPVITTTNNLTTRSLHNEPSNAAANDHTTRSSLIDSDGYLQFNTLHEMISNANLAYPSNPLFGTYNNTDTSSTPTTKSEGGGSFNWTTYQDFNKQITTCRSMLKTYLNIITHPYSKVGIISNNRHEWATIAATTYSLNSTLVPMYEAQLVKDWIYILNDSGCSVLFVSTEDIYYKVMKEVVGNCPLLREVICFDAPRTEPHSFRGNMRNAQVEYEAATGGEIMLLDDLDNTIEPPLEEDLANLIYTSGTTGKPKGVELIHSNQVSNIKAARYMSSNPTDFPLPIDRSLAFLPWAHSYGQTCELWALISQGASMGICRGIPHILDDLQLVKPTLLYAVPTLYKKVYDGVINTMNDGSGIQRVLMRNALQLGKANAEYRNGMEGSSALGLVDGIKYKVLDDIVLSKIRNRFGGQLRAGFVAGAACRPEIINFMDSIGISVCEGYGLTETAPVIALNLLSKRKAGSVGQIIPGVNVWIVDAEGNALEPGQEGEICCSGPNVMKGYHNNPEATDEVITLAPDGKSRMFHTGDLGKISSDGFLSVTGRLKEQYKLENGKYVCPTPIEEAIGMSRFISQVVVTGANRQYNVALVVPDWVSIRSELGFTNDVREEELVNDDRVKGLISAEIKLNCYNIKKFEIPAAFLFVSQFTASNNMVTPKMSIRRHVVIKAYDEMISELYDGHVDNGGFLRNKVEAA